MKTRRAFLLGVVLLSAAAFADGPPVKPGVYRKRIQASDGVPLAMFRYVPVGGGELAPPVLLLADFGMTRTVWDAGGYGLAAFLRARGREVYVLEPRGHGSSGAHGRWKLADVVAKDLPAAVDAIGAERAGPVDLVAHGYAGTLALAATTKELQGRVRKVVALATPVDVEVPNDLARTVLADGGRFGALAFDPEGLRVLELLFSKHARISKKRARVLSAGAWQDLGEGASSELLAWMRSGNLTLADGTTVRERLAHYDRPTLELLAMRDNWAHPEAASTLREVAPAAAVKVHLLSVLQYEGEDFAHLSLLQGDTAQDDVFALALEFLNAPIEAKGREVAGEGAP